VTKWNDLCAYAIAPHRPIQAQSACLRHSVALHNIQDRILAQSKTMTDLPIGLTFANKLQHFGREPIRLHALSWSPAEHDTPLAGEP
jgi:hypothetical protein